MLGFFCFTGISFAQHNSKNKITHYEVKRKNHKTLIKKSKRIKKVKATSKVSPLNHTLKAGPSVGETVVPQTTIAKAAETEKGTVTGLPIPRFLCLRADEVNMRSGPGTRYPIIWIYHRRHMPMKVIREFDNWRLVEDIDGQKGWVQQAILSDKRTFIIKGIPLSTKIDAVNFNDSQNNTTKEVEHTDSLIIGYIADKNSMQLSKDNIILKKLPQDQADAKAILKPGVVGDIKECPAGSEWCKVAVKDIEGWIPREVIWGTLPQENVQVH